MIFNEPPALTVGAMGPLIVLALLSKFRISSLKTALKPPFSSLLYMLMLDL